MISGTLPNNTVWWLSTDGLKIWIESRDLEQARFKEKGYNIVHGRIFRAKKDVGRRELGELTTSRLDSRRRQDAWIIKLEAILDIYPELLEEINRKEKEVKKKKRPRKSTNNIKIKPIIKEELQIKEQPKTEKEENKVVNIEENNIEENNIEENNIDIENKVVEKVNRKDTKDYFDIDRPYVAMIKDEISKNERGKIIIPLKDLKEKMGNEFLNMHDMRIYFGLKKVLSSIGILIELKSSKGETVAIMKKTV